MWSDKISNAVEEGWQIDDLTGALLDDDDDYSHESQQRREAHRADVAAIREQLRRPPVREHADTTRSDDEDNDDGDDDEVMQEYQEAVRDARFVPRGIVTPLPVARPNVESRNDDIAPHQVSSFVYVDIVNEELFTEEWCHRALEVALRRWCPQPDDARHYAHPLTVTCRRLRLDWDGLTMPPTIDKQQLRKRYRAEISALFELQSRACQANMFHATFQSDVMRVCTSIYNGFHSLLYLLYQHDAWSPFYSPPSDPCVVHFKPMDVLDPELTDYHRLVLFLLARTHEYRYRRYQNTYLCERVVNPDNIFVHTYRQVCTIQDFVYNTISMNDHFEMWKSFVKENRVASALIDYLSKCDDPSLPVLVKDRYVHAFRNGLYFVQEDHFHAWEDGPVSTDIVACKYHPVDFVRYDGGRCVAVDFEGDPATDGPRVAGTAYDIPTPLFDKILLDQEIPYAARIWVYVMMGRMLYWAREKDSWQVCAFFYGLAGTGKSTMCKIFERYFYEKADVAQISNTFEKVFGIWSISDKFGVFASEVGEDFGIDRTELQQMISAETMTIRAKNQKALPSFDWLAHVLLAGNHIPTWTDAQGAMARRLLIWIFRNKVEVDGHLFEKMQAEIAHIIIKCNRMYRAAVEHVGDRSIWEALPTYFNDSREMLQAAISPVHGFLSSEEVVVVRTASGEIDESVYVPLAVLKEKYMAWRATQGNKGVSRWNAETYTKALNDKGLSAPVKRRLAYPRDGAEKTQAFYVIGIDLAEEVQRLDNRQVLPAIREDDE